MLINDILEELRDGKTVDELAKEFTDALNQAETRRKAELEVEQQKEFAQSQKREAMRNVIDAINDYYAASGEEDKEIEEIDDKLIDLMCSLVDNLTISTEKTPTNFSDTEKLLKLLDRFF